MRVGIGLDAHAFDPARPLIIGGVTIPEHPGLAGHSDADVLSHAVADALLGAAALGDIGTMFPDDDRWRGASSLSILAVVTGTLKKAGYRIANVDSTVVAEAPRLGPHIDEMRSNLAAALAIDLASMSVKATTTDRMGFTGRAEGIAAMAVALLQPLG